MKKHPILLFSIVFVLGLIIGGAAVVIYFENSVAHTMQLVMLKQRANLEEKAFQAYFNESPQIAIWALENLKDALKEQLKILKVDDQLVQKDLVLTNARLAILYKREGNKNKYEYCISKALELAKVAYAKEIGSENDLLSFVKKLDEIWKTKKQQNT